MKKLNEKGIKRLDRVSLSYLNEGATVKSAEYEEEDFTLKILFDNGVSHTVSFTKPYLSIIETSEGTKKVNLPFYVIKRIYALLVPRNFIR